MRTTKKPTLCKATVFSTLFTATLLQPCFSSANQMSGNETIRQPIAISQKITPNRIGVLVYTHGVPNDPLQFNPDNDKITAIENDLENFLRTPAEKILHMPYTWDFGLMSLNKSGVKYSILLYTDMFGPDSTVIHNVTRIFAGIENVDTCPGLLINESNSGSLDSSGHTNYTKIVQKYGPICSYMGAITIPAPKFSDSTIVLAEPARPDHPILREIFVKQVKSVSQKPKNEIIVFVGHGAKKDFNDEAQKKELSTAANYAERKLGFLGSIGVTAREDWPSLSDVAVPKAVSEIKSLLNNTGAKNVILVPATGGHGFNMIAEALDKEGIPYVSAPKTLPLGEMEFRKWALNTTRETINFIKREKPTKSTTTPYWNRTYNNQ